MKTYFRFIHDVTHAQTGLINKHQDRLKAFIRSFNRVVVDPSKQNLIDLFYSKNVLLYFVSQIGRSQFHQEAQDFLISFSKESKDYESLEELIRKIRNQFLLETKTTLSTENFSQWLNKKLTELLIAEFGRLVPVNCSEVRKNDEYSVCITSYAHFVNFVRFSKDAIILNNLAQLDDFISAFNQDVLNPSPKHNAHFEFAYSFVVNEMERFPPQAQTFLGMILTGTAVPAVRMEFAYANKNENADDFYIWFREKCQQAKAGSLEKQKSVEEKIHKIPGLGKFFDEQNTFTKYGEFASGCSAEHTAPVSKF